MFGASNRGNSYQAYVPLFNRMFQRPSAVNNRCVELSFVLCRRKTTREMWLRFLVPVDTGMFTVRRVRFRLVT